MMNSNFLNHEKWLSKSRLLCGVMTGTSVDSVDTSIVKFTRKENNEFEYELLAYSELEIPEMLKDDIHETIEGKTDIVKICSLNFNLAYLYAESINLLCGRSGFDIEDIDAVGVHGQTVWHSPDEELSSTLQLGNLPAMAKHLEKCVVGDFRSADIALAGQGAPLIPIFDYEFLRSKTKNRICMNIGGISNITKLKAGGQIDEVIAFDTGPGNVLIDTAMRIIYGDQYDDKGEIARSGELIPELFESLKEISYFKKKPPKSTGRELFNEPMVHNAIIKYASEPNQNIVRTFTELTSWSIVHNIKEFVADYPELIISGGGLKNDFLIEQIKKELPNMEVHPSDDFGIPFNAKESICFAYLAYRTLGGLHGNISSVTGAMHETVLGSIALP